MANFSLQELKDIQAEYTRAQAEGIPISKELAQRYKDATVGIKNYSRQLEGSLKQFGSSLLTSVLSNERGASKYNGALTAGADAFSDFAMKFGPLGMAAGLATKGLTLFVTAVAKQSDALFKTYQDLSQTGITGAKGMRGVFENLQDFGFTVDKIGEYTSLLQANSDTLVRFGNTANEGAARMGDITKTIRDSGAGKNLRLLGMSSEAIANSTLSYAKLQATLGQSQKMTDQDLIDGGIEYAEELLKASKLTGMSQKDLMDADQRAVTDAQLGSYLNLEYEKALNVGTKEAMDDYEERKTRILGENRMMESRSKELGEAYRSLRAGGTLNEKALAALRTVPNAAAAIARGASQNEIADILKRDVQEYGTSINTIRQVTGENKAFLGVQSSNSAVDRKNASDSEKAADKELNATDKATKSAVELDISQQNITQAFDSLTNLGIMPVTATLAGFANAIDFLLNPFGRNRRGGVAEADKQNVAASQGSTAESMNAGAAGELTKKEQEAGNVNADGTPRASTPPKPVTVPKPETTKTNSQKEVPAGSPETPSSDKTTGSKKEPMSNPAPLPEAPSSTAPKSPTTTAATDVAGPKTPEKQRGYANGGVVSGPRSGYTATLHGTEAVVPLPDGKTIPVDMPDLSGVLNDQSELLSGVLSTLDDIVKNMEAQVSVSKKILQRQM
jgi:hypothetical protein